MNVTVTFAPMAAWAPLMSCEPNLGRRVLVSDIQAEVSRHYGLPIIEMRSARRSRYVAWPRQVAMYIAKRLTRCSLPEIGRRFGGRDHTTVIHGIRAVGLRRAVDAELDADIRAIEAALS